MKLRACDKALSDLRRFEDIITPKFFANDIEATFTPVPGAGCVIGLFRAIDGNVPFKKIHLSKYEFSIPAHTTFRTLITYNVGMSNADLSALKGTIAEEHIPAMKMFETRGFSALMVLLGDDSETIAAAKDETGLLISNVMRDVKKNLSIRDSIINTADEFSCFEDLALMIRKYDMKKSMLVNAGINKKVFRYLYGKSLLDIDGIYISIVSSILSKTSPALIKNGKIYETLKLIGPNISKLTEFEHIADNKGGVKVYLENLRIEQATNKRFHSDDNDMSIEDSVRAANRYLKAARVAIT